MIHNDRKYWCICENNFPAMEGWYENLEAAKEGFADWHGNENIENSHIIQIYSYAVKDAFNDYEELLPYDEWNNPNHEE